MPEDDFLIDRRVFTDLSTIGDFYIKGDIFCRTLELSCRKASPLGKLAIPAGKYRLSVNDQPTTEKELKFGFTVIQVHDVVGRENIEIHPGNVPSDSRGCILPGMRSDMDIVYDSRSAFFKIKEETIKRLGLGPVYLQVVGGR